MKYFIVVFIAISVLGCKKKANVTCGKTVPSFSGQVLPLIQVKCGACHGSGTQKGGVTLTNYEEIVSHKSSIRDEVVDMTMPPTGSLTTGNINTICCWIDNDAPNN